MERIVNQIVGAGAGVSQIFGTAIKWIEIQIY
jgi:hypothetical protein